MVIDERLIGALHLRSGGAGALAAAPAGHPAHRAFQTSTLAALLDGAYDGDVSFAELARQGDFGLGTLNGCDGEMIAIDGRFLRADEHGRISEIEPAALTPFAALTFFSPRHRFAPERGGLDFDQLTAAIDRRVGRPEVVHAIRVDGSFERVHCRSVPKQRKPYRPLAEVVAEQRVFDLDGEGTIVGFRFPDLGLGVGVPGYHLHFVSADRSRGGHVLDCRTGPDPDAVRIAVDDLCDLWVETPPGIEVGGAAVERAAVEALERERD